MARSRRFGFPNPVNETSARLVAGGVVLQGIFFLVVRQWWALVPLAYGFLARVLAGPSFSPLGQFVTRVLTPQIAEHSRIEHRFVAGPPKRFAQGVGLVFSGGALLAWALGAPTVSIVLIVGLVVAASLEAFLAVCLGCIVFGQLMKRGIVPDSVCESCNDISARLVSTH